MLFVPVPPLWKASGLDGLRLRNFSRRSLLWDTLAWVQQGQEEKVRAFAAQLLRDLEQNKKVLEDLEELWCDGQLVVLKKALTAAAELGVGLLEATEVVEPNPIAPNESTSYSNLYHCDRDGVYLYIDMAIRQIAQAMGKNTDDR